MFRIGQGLALTTNPYNRETDYRNNAFGSKILSAACVMLNYKKEHLFDRFGLQVGFSLLH